MTVERGRKIILAIIAILLFSAFVKGTFIFFLEGIILFFVYKGHEWAKWLITILLFYWIVLSFVFTSSVFNIFLLLMVLVYLAIGVILISSSSVKKFMIFQKLDGKGDEESKKIGYKSRSFIEFLQPDRKKIIVLLILHIPILLVFLPPFREHIPLPAQFNLLNDFISFSGTIIVIPTLFVSLFFGGWDSGGGLHVPGNVATIIVFSSGIIFWYIISCFIVLVWNEIFGLFSEKSHKYGKILIMSFIIVFVFIAIILPAIGTYFVIIETNTPQNISFDEAFRLYTTPDQVINYTIIPVEHAKLQELTIQNQFILPVTYELPNVTACVYDIEGNLKWGYTIYYTTEDGRSVKDRDPHYRNVIVAKPRTETKVYIQEWVGIQSPGIGFEEQKNNLEKFDEIILLSNVGMNNYNYCYNATEEDVLASEKIKILK